MSTFSFSDSVLLCLASALLWGSYYNPIKHCKSFRDLEYSNSLLVGGSLIGWLIAYLVNGNFLALLISNTTGVLAAVFGGFIWAAANYCALMAIKQIGLARGYVIMNLSGAIVFVLGVLVFGELRGTSLILAFAVLGICLMTLGTTSSALSAKTSKNSVINLKNGLTAGLVAALGFGGFVGFTVPFSMNNGVDPLTFCALSSISGLSVCLVYSSLVGRIKNWVKGLRRDHILGVSGGVMWNLGNIFNFLAIPTLGVSVAFPLGLTNIVVANLWGIVYYGELKSASRRSLQYAIMGAITLVLGATILGYARYIAN